jgi:arabinofuranosyltransferase
MTAVRPSKATSGDVIAARPPTEKPEFTRPIVVVLIGCLLLLAYGQRFLADDAFISFRYAQNLAQGDGLVFNPGERVEGYTNFLWVLMLAGGLRLGVSPEVSSQVLGLAFFGGTLTLTYHVARLVLASPWWAMVTVLLLGTHFSVLSFATSGLETSLQTCLLIAGCGLVLRSGWGCEWRVRDLLTLSLIVSAGILTRMDFAVFAVVLVPAAMVSALVGRRRAEPGFRQPAALYVGALLAPSILIVGTWLAWKIYYYGSPLPNTYYARVMGLGSLPRGAAYLWAFCGSYLYEVCLVVLAVGIVQLIRQRHVLLVSVAVIAAWAAYLVAIGGDFIEFRFLVPIMPLFFVCLVWTIVRFPVLRRLHLHVIILAWVAYGSLHHRQTYTWDLATQRLTSPLYPPESIGILRGHVEDSGWAEAGQALDRWFDGQDVSLATTAAGALPYYAGLGTLDMHGLCDRQVARFGRIIGDRPGHQRLASLDYMKRRGTNLVLGQPWIMRADQLDALPTSALSRFTRTRDPGEPAVVVAIPIGQEQVLLAWYLTPHPAVDRAITSNGWRTFNVPASTPGARAIGDRP